MGTMRGIKLFQGYLWHPRELEFDPKQALPRQLGAGLEDGPVYVLIDPVRPPFAFFENGTPTAGQSFYQVTLLMRSEKPPHELKALTQPVSEELEPYLQATPQGVGWLLLEDLREV